MAGDVYTDRENYGVGGWTWYTGSAAWYYVTVLHDLLGIQKEGDNITVDPHVPADWQEYTVSLRADGCSSEVLVRNPDGKTFGPGRAHVSEKDGVKKIQVTL